MNLGQQGQGEYEGRIGPLAILGGVALAIWKLSDREPPGRQQKVWRGMPDIDKDLKDEWLERLNSIDGISIGGSCAGHPASPEHGLHADEAFLSVSVEQPAHALEVAKKVFGDLAFYVDFEKDPDTAYLPLEAREQIALENKALARQQGKMFEIDGGRYGAFIFSPYSYEELRGERFQEWWETLVSRVEEMGAEISNAPLTKHW